MVISSWGFFSSLSPFLSVIIFHSQSCLLRFWNISTSVKNNKNKQSDKEQEFSPRPVSTKKKEKRKKMDLPFKYNFEVFSQITIFAHKSI